MRIKLIDKNIINKKIVTLQLIFILFCLTFSINSYALDAHPILVEESFEHLDSLSEKAPRLALKAAKKLLIEQEKKLSSVDKTTLLVKIAQYSYFIRMDEQSQQYIDKAYALEPDLTSDTGILLLLTHATLLTNKDEFKKVMPLLLQAKKNAIDTKNNKRLAEKLILK